MSAKVNLAISPDEVSGLILAGGDGIRVGEGPKAFLKLGDKVLLEHVIKLIGPYAGELIAGLPADHLERVQAYVGQPPFRFVAGGKTRQDTVGILVRLASRPFVVLHDVARPLTRRDHVEAALGLVRDHGAVVSVRTAKPRDGVALREGNYYAEALPRERVILSQTPQAYRREILLEAFRQAEAQGWQEVSTAALVTKAGFSVRLLESSAENLKITYPGDLERAHDHLADRRTAGAKSRFRSSDW
jgi:2-C-methyl-D-erythritol 4-phosphate cytidylyltransferase